MEVQVLSPAPQKKSQLMLVFSFVCGEDAEGRSTRSPAVATVGCEPGSRKFPSDDEETICDQVLFLQKLYTLRISDAQGLALGSHPKLTPAPQTFFILDILVF